MKVLHNTTQFYVDVFTYVITNCFLFKLSIKLKNKNMQLDKVVAIRLTNQDQEKLKDMAWDKRMKLSSYLRFILNNHIKENI